MRQVFLFPENGKWTALCPSLPDCLSEGQTREEAITTIQEAIAQWVEDAKAQGEPIPEDLFEAMVVVVEPTLRQVMLYPGEDGYWVVLCPSLPGCISQGKTSEEAITNIKEAIELYIEVLQESERPVPEEDFQASLMVVPTELQPTHG